MRASASGGRHAGRRRALQRASALATAGVSTPTVVATAYLAVVTVAALKPAPRPPAASRSARSRFAVLIPAHNEGGGITDTLSSLARLDYPAPLYDVHVVADNCTDDTAQVARASGVAVHERVAPASPGKGPALNWLRDELLAGDDPFDAVVIIDADTSVDRGFLAAADAHLQAGEQVLQGFYSVRNPLGSSAAAFRHAALACRHYLRPLGRARLGGSCGLYGNGMVLTRAVVTGHDFSGHLVEDAELQNELLLEGIKVAFAPDAVVRAEMPDDLDGARSQNARWERGRIELARRFVPPLARRVMTGPDRRAAADAVLDHVTPPFSTLVAGHVVGASVAATAAALGARTGRRALAVHGAGIAVLLGHVIAGLVAVGAPARLYIALLAAPRHVLWKVGVWFGVASGRERASWTRTRRNDEAR